MKNNKTLLIIMAFAMLLATINTSLNAQKFEKGDKDVNLTIGVGTPLWNIGGNSYVGSVTMGLPLIAVSADYGLLDNLGPGVIGVGAFLGIATYKWGYLGSDGYRYTEVPIAARATYHYQFVKKLDTYGGFLLGARIDRGKWKGPDITGYGADNRVRPMAAFLVGAKYYVAPKFAVMAELSAGAALLNIGAALKF